MTTRLQIIGPHLIFISTSVPDLGGGGCKEARCGKGAGGVHSRKVHIDRTLSHILPLIHLSDALSLYP